MSPAVLILDEPTNGVDVGARQTIYRRVREEAAAGISFLVVSSDAAELAQLCDRVLCMERGSVACELSGDDQTEAGIAQHLQGAVAR
jgi:ribose transport system ATP-binding protein